jgi:hypothetical protein
VEVPGSGGGIERLGGGRARTAASGAREEGILGRGNGGFLGFRARGNEAEQRILVLFFSEKNTSRIGGR